MIIRWDKNGFTLIEIMVAMVIASVVMAAIYSVYGAQTKSHRTQQMVVEMHQNVRAAMLLLEKDIRMAGFDMSDPPAGARLEADFSAYISQIPHVGNEPKTDTNPAQQDWIAFTMDEDQDGRIDYDVGAAGHENVNNELIAYRLNNNNLETWKEDPDNPGNWIWQTVAENITGLDLRLLPESGDIPTADLTLVRRIEIIITAQTRDGTRSMTATNQVKCRNLSF